MRVVPIISLRQALDFSIKEMSKQGDVGANQPLERPAIAGGDSTLCVGAVWADDAFRAGILGDYELPRFREYRI